MAPTKEELKMKERED